MGSEASSNDCLRFLFADGSPPPCMVIADGSPPPCMVIADGSPPPCMVIADGSPPPCMVIGWGDGERGWEGGGWGETKSL